MSDRMTRRFGVGAALVLIGMLSACATAPGAGSEDAAPTSSPPSDTAAVETLEVEAAWLAEGAMVAVLTRGGSSCLPTAIVATGMPPLQVTLFDGPGEACAADDALRGQAVVLEENIDPAEDLPIEVSLAAEGAEETPDPPVRARGEVLLRGVAGLERGSATGEGEPSAGWTGRAGLFALLTWGSSGCAPIVQDAALTAPGEITVTFVEPPADQICTADFAPRVTAVDVPGTEPGVAYEAVLNGDGFEGARVPILSTP